MTSREREEQLPVAHQHKSNMRLAAYSWDEQGLYTVKGARGKVSFESQNDKYASKLSYDASPEVYLSHLIYQMTNVLHSYPELQIRLRWSITG
jgi:hypothetical protein